MLGITSGNLSSSLAKWRTKSRGSHTASHFLFYVSSRSHSHKVSQANGDLSSVALVCVRSYVSFCTSITYLSSPSSPSSVRPLHRRFSGSRSLSLVKRQTGLGSVCIKRRGRRERCKRRMNCSLNEWREGWEDGRVIAEMANEVAQCQERN